MLLLKAPAGQFTGLSKNNSKEVVTLAKKLEFLKRRFGEDAVRIAVITTGSIYQIEAFLIAGGHCPEA